MAKTSGTNKSKTVEEYLQALPATVRNTLERVRKAIKAAAPRAKELISYQVPCYKQNGMLVGFAAINDHCSFFVMSPGLVRSLSKELSGYDFSGATIRFSFDKPLPATLVKKLVKARMEENEAKANARTAKNNYLKKGSTKIKNK